MTTPPILLVEDDEMMRETVRLLLEQDGWTILTATNGAEGLAVAREHKYELSLVIADLVMPVMSGREMVREMRSEQPGVRIIIMSGYDNFAITNDPYTDGLLWLEKPFKPQQLFDTVRAAVPSTARISRPH